jgi:hypothetical protein
MGGLQPDAMIRHAAQYQPAECSFMVIASSQRSGFFCEMVMRRISLLEGKSNLVTRGTPALILS